MIETANRLQRQIRVLVADDSATVRWHLTSVINSVPGLEVIGEAKDGTEVLNLVPQLKPDVVSMDINMPRMDGLEATRRLMMEHPTPVVVVSALLENDLELSFQALQAGALAVVEKPPDRNNPQFPEKQRQLTKTLVAMSAVRVIRRGRTALLTSHKEITQVSGTVPRRQRPSPEVIAIGASTGGPGALNNLLKWMPVLPVPIVLVQHMADEFITGLARWMGKSSGWSVRVASNGMILEPGVVHLSPGKAHLVVARHGKHLVAQLVSEPGDHRYHPAVNMLFQSVAETCGAAAIGLVMTGMGDDGADGLLAMRMAGARTLAQDQATSVVFGMPGTAIERGAVEEVLPLDQIPLA
ncbi:MAG TPA: chemotaxis-specific protein-glutamate methyltransferase CheB, partial [Phototrophicaceae bacterium]|nr:chemotaxis-specific protein-glutamate methyltransferase CheB [Phototrophicaceae bacterium]